MNSKSKKIPLTFSEYHRLHNVIHSLSENWNKNAGRSCVFFSIVGAALMHKHYALNAKVVCGSGAVMLDPKSETVISWFKQNEDGTLTIGPEAFHAWIECDGWLIDLMAPNYREAMIGATFRIPAGKEGEKPTPFVVPRMMLQKPIDRTEGALDDMSKAGDCVFVPDRDVTTSIIDRSFDRPQLGDIINIAYAWHRPLPKKMESSITITDDLGKLTTIALVKRDLVGAW